MTRFAAISTFNRDGLELYGRRMADSFCRQWPGEISLRLYSEGWDARDLGVDQSARIEVLDLASASPWLTAFKANNSHRPLKDFRWDAVRFAHKAAAVCHAAQDIDCDVLIWLDGDIFTHAPLALRDLEDLRPRDGEWIAWLDRGDMYPECGFYMLNRRHPRHGVTIATFEAMYAAGHLYRLDEYHDSFVLRHVIESVGIPWRSLSGAARTTSHPLVNGPLGAWFDHLKGNRKREARSRPGDLKVARKEAYWRK